MKRYCLLILWPFLVACQSTTNPGEVGINRQQFLLVPAGMLEEVAASGYADQIKDEAKQGKIVRGRELRRIKKIAEKLIAHVGIYREDAVDWEWEVNLIDRPIINATCAPGGKITFYTGIIRRLKMTDGEIAAVMGHEIAHALREHGRERVSQHLALSAGGFMLRQAFKVDVEATEQMGELLFTLPNSRTHELEADIMGMELAARAGYDPRASITFQKKMLAHDSGGTQPEFLSTHPSGESRIRELDIHLAKVMPIYEEYLRAKALAKKDRRKKGKK